MLPDDQRKALREKLAALEARERGLEERGRQASEELDHLRADPQVRAALDTYARDFADGDPTWWKPELEAAARQESERRESATQAAGSARRRSFDLPHITETLASVIIRRSPEQLERLSQEVGISVADLQAFKDPAATDAARRTGIAVAIMCKVVGTEHSVEDIRGRYGLEGEHFEQLPEGPRNRGAKTMVGRQDRPEVKRFKAAEQGITGTARLAVPAAVASAAASGGKDSSSPPPASPDFDELPPTPAIPMSRVSRLWPVAIGLLILSIVAITLLRSGSDDSKPAAASPAASQPGETTAAPGASAPFTAPSSDSSSAERPAPTHDTQPPSVPSTAPSSVPPPSSAGTPNPSPQPTPRSTTGGPPPFPDLDERRR
jgi:hypothetical protein